MVLFGKSIHRKFHFTDLDIFNFRCADRAINFLIYQGDQAGQKIPEIYGFIEG